MRGRLVRLTPPLALLALAAAVGCTRHCVPAEYSRKRTLVDLCAEPNAHAPLGSGLVREVAEEFRKRGAAKHAPGARPYNILALSGGGVYGAFGVGVLNGWTASGTRPEFDVVTGISTGAFIATFAFLGPQYDAYLKETAIEKSNQRDLIRRVPFPAIPVVDALYTAAPLERETRRAITAEVLCEVARGHAAGRRLYIGTTNLDTRKLVIWDMGAIAQRGTQESLDLYRSILLASGAIPGVLPAVRIPVEVDGRKYDEMHVDGGVSDEVIFRGFMVGDLNRIHEGAGSWAPAGSTLYVVTNGKLYADAACVPRRLFSILSAARAAILYGKGRDEFYRVYANCLETGVDFRMTAIPQDLPIGTNALRLNREERLRVFNSGYRVGAENGNGAEWRDVPPGTDPTEQAMPRSGTKFMSVPKADGPAAKGTPPG